MLLVNNPLFGRRSLQQDHRLSDAEVAGTTIPGQSRIEIGLDVAQMGLLQERGIERLPQSQRCLPISSIDRSFIKEARRGDIADAEETITPRHQRRGGQARRRRRSRPVLNG